MAIAELITAVSVSALFVILGRKFSQGKWLSFIAGNTLVSAKDYDRPDQRKLGKLIAKTMYVWAMPFALMALGVAGDLFDLSSVSDLANMATGASWILVAASTVFSCWRYSRIFR